MGTMLKTWLMTILLLFGAAIYGLFVLLDGKFGLPDLPDDQWIMGAAISGGVLQFLALLFAVGISGRKQTNVVQMAIIALLFPVLGLFIVAFLPAKRPELPSRSRTRAARA